MYEIVTTPSFEKSLDKLSKRFKKIYNDLEVLEEELIKNPNLGQSLGKNVYKIRLKNSDINKGKSKGYRVITYIIDDDKNIFLLEIYFKGDKSDINENEIEDLINKI